jgi:hypothetical protein
MKTFSFFAEGRRNFVPVLLAALVTYATQLLLVLLTLTKEIVARFEKWQPLMDVMAVTNA